MMGRSPDFMNVTYAAWAGAADYFSRGRPAFGDNMRRYYELIRENDLVLTHALVNLQRSRNASGVYNLEEDTALRAVRETDAGVVVRGARILATLGPFADEIAVYSPRVGLYAEKHSPFALSFAIPCGTSGLKFLCRDSLDEGRSHFDQPLTSRFEEMDCVVFFDDVLVPWERVFLLGDVGLLNDTAKATHYSAHSAHQNAAKNLAKCELVLGLALLMTETLGNTHLPHTEAYIGELMLTTTLVRAAMRAAEADAKLDEWGVMCPEPVMIESTRNLFMTAYPRMVEILQLLGSSRRT
jgi:4-hydroxyphenylacetate 3-monooxygenase